MTSLAPSFASSEHRPTRVLAHPHAPRFLTSRNMVAYLGLDAMVRQSGQARALNVHGIRLMPWMNPLRSNSGSPASMSGMTRSISPKIAFSCVRASEAPMQ